MPSTQPTLPRYYIVSLALGLNEQPLYLTEQNNQVVVRYQPSPSAVWHLIEEQGTRMIVNVQSGRALYATPFGGQVFMAPASPSPNTLWAYAHHTPFQTALQPLVNGIVVLNVQGNSYPDGTPVISFHWDGSSNSR